MEKGLRFAMIALVALCCACRSSEVESSWRHQAIVVDGDDGEWEEGRFYFEEHRLGMGVRNDGEHLYLCLVLGDRSLQAQILRRGFSVYFDPQGGKKKVVGIRFPLGGRLAVDEESGPPDVKHFQDQVAALLSRSGIEVLGPGKEQLRSIREPEGMGIAIALAYARGRLVYELKVPLQGEGAEAFALGARPGERIGVGFETHPGAWDAMRQKAASRQSSLGGGRYGGMAPAGGSRAEALRIWTRIGLADKDHR